MNIDNLTGMMQFEDFISQAGIAISDKSKNYMIAAVDICDFHYININYGYDTGDEILKGMADVIKNYLPTRKMLFACHSYSDHFICLFQRTDNTNEKIYAVISEFKEIFAGIVAKYAPGIVPNLNVGVYYVEKDEDNVIAAIDKANIARRMGKGNFSIPCVIYTDHLMDIKENSAKVLPVFDESYRNGTILVYLQPKISAATKKIVGAEALSRLVDSEGKTISPAMFIAALEKTGKIVDLDFYVLRYVARLIRKWLDSGLEPVPISFNLSRLHFFSDTIVEDIMAVVNEYNVPAKYVEVEVTESVFFEESKTIIDKVDILRQNGFKVSVDDFGAGYSSLNLIGILPVDVIKLDKGFVKDSLKTKRGNDIIRGLIKILNEIELEIVCEGVETHEEEAVIKEYGCNDIQGFLYDRPIPVSEFEKKYADMMK